LPIESGYISLSFNTVRMISKAFQWRDSSRWLIRELTQHYFPLTLSQILFIFV